MVLFVVKLLSINGFSVMGLQCVSENVIFACQGHFSVLIGKHENCEIVQ